LVVGVIGYFAPLVLGVGYDNIELIVGGRVLGMALVTLALMKWLAWTISLGSGTSGGTLAPLFTIGAGMGALLGSLAGAAFPNQGIDLRMAALVGMAALFAGASRALLTSVVFAFETTRQPLGLLPLLGGCTAAYLVSSLGMTHTIMTEKIARRGVRVPADYAPDFLDMVLVRDRPMTAVITLRADHTIDQVRSWFASAAPGSTHQGYPVVDQHGDLVGVITRRNLFDAAQVGSATIAELIHRPAVVVFDDSTLREAADHMVREGVGRLPVVSREGPRKVIGIVTRSDLLAAHGPRLGQIEREKAHFDLAWLARRLASARIFPPR
jgi:CIC family chloride channel protein